MGQRKRCGAANVIDLHFSIYLSLLPTSVTHPSRPWVWIIHKYSQVTCFFILVTINTHSYIEEHTTQFDKCIVISGVIKNTNLCFKMYVLSGSKYPGAGFKSSGHSKEKRKSIRFLLFVGVLWRNWRSCTSSWDAEKRAAVKTNNVQ